MDEKSLAPFFGIDRLPSRFREAMDQLLQFFDRVLGNTVRLRIVGRRWLRIDAVPLAVVDELVRLELGTSVRKNLLWDPELGELASQVGDHFAGLGGVTQAESDWPAGELVSAEQPLSPGVVAEVQVDVLEGVRGGLVGDEVVGWV